MALDKLVDSTQLDADLTSVANAIRTKGGTSAQLAFPVDFVSAVEDIETGGASLQHKFDVIPASTAAAITFPRGDYSLPTNYACFIVSDNTSGDGANTTLTTLAAFKTSSIAINGAANKRIGNVQIVKASGATDWFNTPPTLAQSGDNISISSTQGKFLAGTTYHVWLYDFDPSL